LIKAYLASTVLLFSLIGCNENGDNFLDSREMIIDKTYTVKSGDKIEKRSSDATLQIDKNSQRENSVVTLIKGKAVLIRK